MKIIFKKKLALILSCIMVLSTFVPAFAGTSTSDYGSHWASDTIQAAIDSGLAKGYPDGSFKPDQPITRSEFFSLVNNAFDFTVASDFTYTDVLADAWYASVIAKAKAAEYIVGYPDGGIHPEMNISRQEVAVIVGNINPLTPVATTVAYKDASTIAAWSKQAVIAAFEAKVMVGYPDGSFKPEKSITRAEALMVLENVLNYQVVVQDPPPITEDPVIVDVETLSADMQTMTLFVGGEAKTITATFTPADATDKTINWVSSDADVATVNDGIVTPVASGTAEITGTSAADATLIVTTAVTVNEETPVVVIPPVTPAVGNPVDLGLAGNYVILAKTGISSVPSSAITGNIGVSPIDSTGITGFSLTMDATNEFSISSQLTGKAYASDYTAPTASNLTTAISNMETAYTDASGRAADYTELHGGDLSGKTLTAGVYKWGTGVLINSDVTLSGGPDDVFIFQIGGGITQASNTRIILSGGIQAKNIFWQAADSVSIGTGSHFEGIVLSMTNITVGTNATVNGRLLAQTAVTLDQATVVQP